MRSFLLASVACLSLISVSFPRAYAIQAPASKRSIRADSKCTAFVDVGGKAADAVAPEGSKRRRGITKVIDALFDKADTNNDGTISMSEAYPLVLLLYVKLNQKAPVSPPSKEKVEALFRTADADRNGRINRDEFERLMLLVGSRATARVVTYKVVSTLVAPVLAVHLVGRLAGSEHLSEITNAIVEKVPEKIANTLLSEKFWIAALIVLFVKTLGKIAVALAAFFLDLASLKDDEEDEDA